jgi:hypothetical protein
MYRQILRELPNVELRDNLFSDSELLDRKKGQTHRETDIEQLIGVFL